MDAYSISVVGSHFHDLASCLSSSVTPASELEKLAVLRVVDKAVATLPGIVDWPTLGAAEAVVFEVMARHLHASSGSFDVFHDAVIIAAATARATIDSCRRRWQAIDNDRYFLTRFAADMLSLDELAITDISSLRPPSYVPPRAVQATGVPSATLAPAWYVWCDELRRHGDVVRAATAAAVLLPDESRAMVLDTFVELIAIVRLANERPPSSFAAPHVTSPYRMLALSTWRHEVLMPVSVEWYMLAAVVGHCPPRNQLTSPHAAVVVVPRLVGRWAAALTAAGMEMFLLPVSSARDNWDETAMVVAEALDDPIHRLSFELTHANLASQHQRTHSRIHAIPPTGPNDTFDS